MADKKGKSEMRTFEG